MLRKILKLDPSLLPFQSDIDLRHLNFTNAKKTLLRRGQSLSDFTNGHLYFGIHYLGDRWVYREWAPGAEKMYVTGDFCAWERHAYPMTKLDNGVFEVYLDALEPGQRVMAVVVHDGKELDRIPLYAKRVVQDPVTFSWTAEITDPKPVATGMSALRKACAQIARRREAPFAITVRT